MLNRKPVKKCGFKGCHTKCIDEIEWSLGLYVKHKGKYYHKNCLKQKQQNEAGWRKNQ
jgi:hypothetical protein